MREKHATDAFRMSLSLCYELLQYNKLKLHLNKANIIHITVIGFIAIIYRRATEKDDGEEEKTIIDNDGGVKLEYVYTCQVWGERQQNQAP